MSLELLPELGGKAGQGGEQEVGGDSYALVFAEGSDVELLPFDVNLVARICR